MKKTVLYFILFCYKVVVFGQPVNTWDEFGDQFRITIQAKKFLKDSLGFDTTSFYNNYNYVSNSNHYYLYVSRRDSLMPPRNFPSFIFCKDSNECVWLSDSISKLNYVTNIYVTSANSGTIFTETLLSYPVEEMVFIIYHEAGHQILKNKNLDYKYVEAFCDRFATELSKRFFRTIAPEQLIYCEDFIKRLESLHKLVNSTYRKIYIDDSNPDLVIESFKNSTKGAMGSSRFLKARYECDVNTASLMRMRYYSKYYSMYALFVVQRPLKIMMRIFDELFTPRGLFQLRIMGNFEPED